MSDATGAAADLADALQAFADKVGAPGAPGEVWVTIGTPFDVEQRSLPLPVNVADWIAELVRDETSALEEGRGSGGIEPGAGPGSSEEWWD